jgi:glutaredoxin-like protein NrdH
MSKIVMYKEVPMEFTHVDGKDKGKVILYAISTCIWCKKTKRLLNEIGVAYDYIDVDLLRADEKEEIRKEVLKWKERVGYPVIVINDSECIPNFEPDKIREVLGG